MTILYVKEAKEILKIIDQYFPKIFDGKDSINWLHNYTTQGKQPEWQGFFFEEFTVSILKHILAGWKGPRIIPGKRFDYAREFTWDFKLDAEYNAKGKKNDDVILNDITATDRILEKESGIGYIIARAKFEYDKSGTLKKWRDQKEKRKSSGRSPILKKSCTITDVFAIFLKNKHELEQAIQDGWISIFTQGRQPDNSPRKPKYLLKINKIPIKKMIRLDS